MEILPLLPFIAVFLSMPLMTGWVAKTDGRNFWLWAGLTCILPGITMIALLILPPKNNIEKDRLNQSN